MRLVSPLLGYTIYNTFLRKNSTLTCNNIFSNNTDLEQTTYFNNITMLQADMFQDQISVRFNKLVFKADEHNIINFKYTLIQINSTVLGNLYHYDHLSNDTFKAE